MKSYSVRLDPQHLERLRSYAQARRLKPSTALRQLALAALRSAESPPPKPAPVAVSADRSLIEQCLSLLRLLALYQLHAFHRGHIQDQSIGSSLRRFQDAQVRTNETLDGDPGLFGRARFGIAETPTKPKA
jgi:hypothetical protein